MKQVTRLTVRSYECDSYGHVNHAVYVNYFEHARMEFLHAAQYGYKQLIADGYFIFVSRISIAYHSPAYADDVLDITTEPVVMRRVSGIARQVIRRGETVVAEAEVHLCVVDRTGRPCRPPTAFNLQQLGGTTGE